MSAAGRLLVAGAATLGFIALCGFGPVTSRDPDVDFIVTAAPAYRPLAELHGGERFPEGAHLLLVKDGKSEPLVAGFAATADADVSFDGNSVLFAGKKTTRDKWQIWELNLTDRTLRQVTSSSDDAVRPFHLPGERLIWAQHTPNGFEIESSDDGHPKASNELNPTASPGVLPLTYLHANAFPTGVLHDGRILFESGFPLGSGAVPEIYLVYADGSGLESIRCDHGRARWGARQLASGDVVFTHGASLARFTSSLSHEEPVPVPAAEYAGAIAESDSGAWLVSVRVAHGTHYAISLWQPGDPAHPARTKLESLLAIGGMDLIDPVVVAPRLRPNRHPSGLHAWNYGNLLALDARVSRDGALRGTPASVRIETQNTSGQPETAGTAPMEIDGSFFVQVPGDRPIRFSLLDRNGAVLRQEHGWFWIRGGEQRYCVGCHAGPERSSENRVPAVLMRSTMPVDLTGWGLTRGSGGGPVK